MSLPLPKQYQNTQEQAKYIYSFILNNMLSLISDRIVQGSAKSGLHAKSAPQAPSIWPAESVELAKSALIQNSVHYY